ncbi:unnamed protein product, partial [Mesorhabditis belari]|uniref:C-type lectin domain-containing protein n=1 Tax=Mesorhabditis belari TaxID=2138241 RepID=A0AAF3FRG6_9BILA
MVRNLIVSAAFLAIALSQCPSDFTQFNNKCYKVFNYNSLTWAQADGSCQDYGGHLASIHDNATDSFLIDYARQVGVRTAAWIGAYWYLEIYAGNNRDTLLYTTTSFSPFNTTLKLSSNNPQMMIRIMTEDNDDVNPFEIHYSGTDSPLYINPTPPSMIKSRANRLH